MIHPPKDLSSCVRSALNEDIGSGDLTAELLSPDEVSTAVILCREQAIVCGIHWVDEVYRQLDATVTCHWDCSDGDIIQPQQVICSISGLTRIILTGERTALNFLQLLSGTATLTRKYVSLIEGSKARLLDTRKTIPGLRTAQKYAVACGGGRNHRMGLYDAILIKENHIAAAGDIISAIRKAKTMNHSIEVEIEELEQLPLAIDAGADTVLLDNFEIDAIKAAVVLNSGRVKLEVSGGVTTETIAAIAATGVDFISVGELTKNVRAIDFSMKILKQGDNRIPLLITGR
jgi:nicotinate-nucleotide pyrophosphorylase (carboxylating)